jgi:NAD(P)H-quinone oxidoreductase subunit 5
MIGIETNWIWIDQLSAVMISVVSIVGFVVLKFSLRYMGDDPSQKRFLGWIGYTLASVYTLLMANHLALFFLAWVSTSYGLHRLLTFYPDRPAAWLAARKKWIISRLGDVFLLFAIYFIGQDFGTLEIHEILSKVGDASALHPHAHSIAYLIMLGAITKSAQFPFHSWLPDTMEAPTPVSAFMHAGIINAGGYLVVRLSPLIAVSPSAMLTLALIGAVTAAFGCIVMLTQTDIKRSLAYSTIGQMGFMMVQCGLGAFTAALIHMVGHAFYKSYAFLSAGGSVASIQAAQEERIAVRLNWKTLGFALGVATLSALGSLMCFNWIMGKAEPLSPLHFVLLLSLAHFIFTALNLLHQPRYQGLLHLRLGVGFKMVMISFGLSMLYLAIYHSINFWVDPILADFESSAVGVLGRVLILALFIIPFVIQLIMNDPNRPKFLNSIYVHFYNGFYLSGLIHRVIVRVWPLPSRSKSG